MDRWEESKKLIDWFTNLLLKDKLIIYEEHCDVPLEELEV